MEKINKRHPEFLLLLCMFSVTAYSQAKSGIENYNLLSRDKEYVWMPVVHYQSAKGVYAELRYNYEDVQTLSLYGGKSFTGGSDLKFNLIPMIGFSTGKFTGVSLAANAELEWENLYFSSQTQYSIGTRQGLADFLFCWSEAGVDISDHFFGGVAIQYTRQAGTSEVDPGFVAGLEFNNISIPVYLFNPFKAGSYFVLGLNYTCAFKKRRSIK